MRTKIIILLAAVISISPLATIQSKAQSMENKKMIPTLSAFPVGDENPEENSLYFIGQSYLAPLATGIFNVTFEPACRNNWHSHTQGQILIVVGGTGYYQQRGEPARVLVPGDVVEIAPDVVHWHGAAPDSWFSHLAVNPGGKDNVTTWLEAVDDEEYLRATGGTVPGSDWRSDYIAPLASADPVLAGIFENFALDETQQYGDLDPKTRILITMASTIAQNTPGEYRKWLSAALDNGITPVEIKEVLYHAVPYVGMARVTDLLGVANRFLAERGIGLPLEQWTDPEGRFERGLALQKSIFGDRIEQAHRTAPADQRHIQRYLSANCFGDYQTRPVLDTPMRELLTYSMLISLGGCESQVKSHIQGNVNVGNDKAVLMAVTTQLLPYIGYPRTLNAISCLNEVLPEVN